MKKFEYEIWIVALLCLPWAAMASPPASADVTVDEVVREHLERTQASIRHDASAYRSQEPAAASLTRRADELRHRLRAFEKSWHLEGGTDRQLLDEIRDTLQLVALLEGGDFSVPPERVVAEVAAPKAGEQIRGRITEEGTGIPVEARVLVADVNGDTRGIDRASADGSYSISLSEPGTYFVWAEEYGYRDELYDGFPCPSLDCDPTTGTPIVVPESGFVEIDFALTKLATISGRVISSDDGVALRGSVFAVRDDGYFVEQDTAGADGIYEIINLQPGTYTVLAEAEQHRSELYDGIPCLGGPVIGCDPLTGTPVTVLADTPTPGIDFELEEFLGFEGRVLAADTGEGLPFVTVRYYKFFEGLGIAFAGRTSTDSSGYYSASNLRPGTYWAVAFDSERHIGSVYGGIACPHVEGEPTCDISLGTPIEVDLETTVTGIELRVELGGSMVGTVRSADDQSPLTQTEVLIRNADGIFIRAADADETGRYLVTGLATGNYTASTSTRTSLYRNEVYDNIPCFDSCPHADGTPIAVSLGEVTAGINFRLETLGQIQGRITHRATGQPLSGVYVGAASSVGFLRDGQTDGNGEYLIFGLNSGEYFVSTRNSDDYVDEAYPNTPCPRRDCEVTAGTPVSVTLGDVTTGIDLQLDRGGSIRGTLQSAASEGSIRTRVTAYDLAGRTIENDRFDGMFELSGLATGDYYLLADNGDGHLAQVYGGGTCLNSCDPLSGTPISVTVEQSTTGIDFILDRYARISGRVTDALSGVSIDSDSVRVWDTTGNDVRSTSSDGEGFYEISNLLPGTYFVTALGEGWGGQVWNGLTCASSWPSIQCDPTQGTPIAIDLNTHIEGIDFTLEQEQGIAGRVTDADTGYGVPGAVVDIWSEAGSRWSVLTGSDGRYALFLDPRSYFLATDNGYGGIDELYDNIPCPGSAAAGACDPLTGTPVVVTEDQAVTGLDFALEGIELFSCQPSGTSLCLQNGRFEVSATWRDFDGGAGSGRAVTLTGDSGYFWFFGAANVEMVVKVLDACVFDRFWVFAAGLTNVEVELTVRDTLTNEVRTYQNPLGLPFAPVLDTDAFATCVAQSPAGTLVAAGSSDLTAAVASAESPMSATEELTAPSSPTKKSTCTTGGSQLCLGGGRFEVEAQWRTDSGDQGSGQAIPLTDDTGYFWFFDEDNVEIVVKVIDACVAPFERFWAFAAGLTNLEIELEVTDLETGESKIYRNPSGQAFQPVLDTNAFATCP